MYIFDTNALLDESFANLEKAAPFIISTVTLQEIEHIKTSSHKDLDVKYKARKILRFLDEHEWLYDVYIYTIDDYNYWIEKFPMLQTYEYDSKIIISALACRNKYITNDITFVTRDLSCKHIAECCGLKVEYRIDKELDNYSGYQIINYTNDDELALIYNQIFNATDNPLNMLYNQYLLLEDKDGNIIDHYRWKGDHFHKLPDFIGFNSKMFGKIKPKDSYQLCAMESLKANQITLLRGPAGSGKSLIALGYLFDQLEHNKIDKIIIFCNTVATIGSAKLGYYPGTKDEKLLDSQIGNFLSSKLGDREAVLEYMERGQLELLPMSDIRGYDSTGMSAGIYITEAQNFDIDLMKLALQRVSEDSICILDGDEQTQVDMSAYAGAHNGIRRVSEVFRGQDFYGEVELKHIYRSRIAFIADRM